MLDEPRANGMNVIRAKCPNCWETDDCEIVETKNWYGKDGAGQNPSAGEAPAGAGYNLKCPTCKGIFWFEIRGGKQPAG
jgi:phage FluMu protein Com